MTTASNRRRWCRSRRSARSRTASGTSTATARTHAQGGPRMTICPSPGRDGVRRPTGDGNDGATTYLSDMLVDSPIHPAEGRRSALVMISPMDDRPSPWVPPTSVVPYASPSRGPVQENGAVGGNHHGLTSGLVRMSLLSAGAPYDEGLGATEGGAPRRPGRTETISPAGPAADPRQVPARRSAAASRWVTRSGAPRRASTWFSSSRIRCMPASETPSCWESR